MYIRAGSAGVGGVPALDLIEAHHPSILKFLLLLCINFQLIYFRKSYCAHVILFRGNMSLSVCPWIVTIVEISFVTLSTSLVRRFVYQRVHTVVRPPIIPRNLLRLIIHCPVLS